MLYPKFTPVDAPPFSRPAIQSAKTYDEHLITFGMRTEDNKASRIICPDRRPINWRDVLQDQWRLSLNRYIFYIIITDFPNRIHMRLGGNI
jgi:hypothetical protein